MTSLQSYDEALRSYEILADRFSFLRKRITVVLICGTLVSLFILGVVFSRFISPPTEGYGPNQSTWDRFVIAAFFAVCAFALGLLARDWDGFNPVPMPPEEITEEEFHELVLTRASEEIDENNEFINKHKKLAIASFTLFLIANLAML